MRFAAKMVAATAMNVFASPEILIKAKEEHKRLTGGKYNCPYPKEK